jgi:hypothetical protein
VAALRQADPPSKEYHQLSLKFVDLLILDGNMPEGLIRQGKKKIIIKGKKTAGENFVYYTDNFQKGLKKTKIILIVTRSHVKM